MRRSAEQAKAGVLSAMERSEESQRPKARKLRRRDLTRPTEYSQRKLVVDWLLLHRVKHFAVPNGAWLHPTKDRSGRARAGTTWNKLRAIGVKAGVSDLIIPQAAANGQPTALEMKRDAKEKPSDEQRYWLNLFEALGWNAIVGYGADDAIEKLKNLGYGR